jgi:hypothetical protein
MATWNTRTVLVCAATALFTAGIVVSGCSSDSTSATPVEAGTTCPATFSAANGKTCNDTGLRCTFQYYCTGNLYQIADCNCTGGKFQCFDQSAPTTPIAQGAAPVCVNANNTKDENCPSSFASADGVTCHVPGKTCQYSGEICAGFQQNDHCQCVAGGNGAGGVDAGLAYKCEKALCALGDASATDSSVVIKDAGTDG